MKKFILFIILVALFGGLYFGVNSYKNTKVEEAQTEVNTVVLVFLNNLYTGELEQAKKYVADDFDIYEKVFLGKLPEQFIEMFVKLLPEDNISIASQTNVTPFDTSIKNVYNNFEGNIITKRVDINFDPELYNKVLSFLGLDNQTLTSTVDVTVQKLDGTWKVVDLAYFVKN